MKEKPFKLPKTVAEAADMYYTKREDRLALGRQVEKLASEETLLREFIIDNLPKSQATGVAGKIARVQITKKPKPTFTDFNEFCKYVARTKSFDLLQKRLNEQAVKERWEDKKEIPGVGTHIVIGVSVTKLSK